MGRKAWMAGFKGIPCDLPGWVQLRNRLPEFHHLEDLNTFMYRRFVERWYGSVLNGCIASVQWSESISVGGRDDNAT